MFWKCCVSLSHQFISPISPSIAKAEEVGKEQTYPGHSRCLLPTSASMQGWHLPQPHISAPHQSFALGLLSAAQARITQLIFLPITQLLPCISSKQHAKQRPTIMQIEEKNLWLKFKSANNYRFKEEIMFTIRMDNLRNNDTCVHFFELHIAVIKW